MYCRYCGKSIVDDSDFCTYCGKLVANHLSDKKETIEEGTNVTCAQSEESFFVKHSSLLVKTFCYVALGVFLLFNIKMAPFYGWWKFVAYIVEGALAICLVQLTEKKIAEDPSRSIRVLSMAFSLIVIISCVILRVIYDAKVDMVENNIPLSGTVLVAVSQDTDYYSHSFTTVYDPSTSVEINGVSAPVRITLGKPNKLEIICTGSGKRGSTNGYITLETSDFLRKKYSVTKTVRLDEHLTAEIKVTVRRYCTFWEVIFY